MSSNQNVDKEPLLLSPRPGSAPLAALAGPWSVNDELGSGEQEHNNNNNNNNNNHHHRNNESNTEPPGVQLEAAEAIVAAKTGMPTPLPLDKMVPIMLLTASESFNSSAIFAYVGYLVLDLHLTEDKNALGNYAGAISSCFFVAQFFSSFFWGKMSDKYGRRPVLLCGTLGTIISAGLFGFSMNLPFAIFSRALCGLLNGNIGVVKTYLGEITDSTNQTKAWSWFSLASGIGTIVGALIGGILARPALKYPKLFAAGHGLFSDLFERFPYLLPNLVAVLVCGLGFVLSYFYLTENKIPQQERAHIYSPLESETESTALVDEESGGQSIEMKDMAGLGSKAKNEIETKETNDLNGLAVYKEKECCEDEEESLQEMDSTLREVKDDRRGFLSTILDIRWPFWQNRSGWGSQNVLLDGQVLISTSLYALTGMLFILIDAIFPLWSMTDPKEGGLGFGTNEIGITTSVGSMSIVAIQLGVYGFIANKIGLVNTFKWGTLTAVPVFSAFPFINYFHPAVSPWSSMAVVWFLILTLYVLRVLVGQLMFCAVMNLINNSVDVYHMGAANGLGQSMVALLRAIGPYSSSVLFAWSMTNGQSFPLNGYFLFLLMSIITISILLLSFLLHHSLDAPKPFPIVNNIELLEEPQHQ